ncbi:MAG TPA: DegT/DnrJ/EryC1/StrS family aminotransferase [Bacteroidales bacterium]|nr:DegT/DnrJ/EryC1/StrS family aminotransferase [Bacteroidales bacterium]
MIPFSPPHIDQKIIDAVAAVLRSGWITTGPKTREFEQKLTEYGGQRATLCVSSATGGLELVLRWFGVQPGDEVIVPAYTYAATANVVVHCGAKVVFVDSGEDFNTTAALISKAITPKTKVILPVDLGGYPCDYDEINRLVERKDISRLFRPGTPEQQQLGRILVLSDAAHSLGAWYKGKHTGNLTDISVYSFHAVKNLTTAEGGAICFNLPAPFDNAAICESFRVKMLHGQTKDALSKLQGSSWKYDITEPGYKYNLTDLQAVIGLVELERYDREVLPRRKKIFDAYARGFAEKTWAQIPVYEQADKTSSYHVFLLRIRGVTESQRDRIIGEIFRNEVSVNVHFVPLPLMTYYKNSGYRMDDYPAAYDHYSREITLPVYYDLTDEQVQTVIRTVTAAVEKIIDNG